MASQDALWAKLWELELQLAAYKLLHAPPARWEGEEEGVPAGGVVCCRGRQYDAYMRRRDARRASVAAAEGGKRQPKLSSSSSSKPSPLTVKCGSRDTQQQARRAPAASASIPATPRKEPRPLLPRSRTLSSSGAAAAPPTPMARSSQPHHHQRRNSVGGEVLGDTPRPFLRRGSGTGGAAAAMRSPSDATSSSPSPRRPRPRDHFVEQVAGAAPAGRHLRSVSELPFHYATRAATELPRAVVETPPPGPAHARARKRWGDVESPPPSAMFSAAASNPHMDLAKGLRKLLSYVRKSKSSAETPRPGVGGGGGKPVMKGWAAATACSVLDGPLDRASLEGHRFPMTRAVGTSG